MKRYIQLFSALLALQLFFLIAGAQPIDSTLVKYSRDYAQEKAWLHLDKSTYNPGETIWFKAYLLEGFLPATGSKTFYVDWVSDNGEVLYHSVSPLVDAGTSGQFEIPENYEGNFIHIKAYTKWMLNFDTSFLFNKPVRVIGKKTPAGAGKVTIQSTLQFFPEGGDAISGIPNKFAFKATDQWGNPVNAKGIIQDDKGKTIDSFKTVHNGMGSVLFVPQQGITYTAKWRDDKGTQHTTSLPAARPEGVSMQVTMDGNKRIVSLQASNLISPELGQLHIIGTSGQALAFKTSASIAAGNTIRRIIPTENLPSGILTITVFDNKWNAIAERITFINNGEYHFKPAMEVQRWGLNKRAKNEIQISIPDSLQGSNLSISVTDAGIDKDTSDTIISHLLLTSDIKGYVHNPAYYFSSSNHLVSQQLDLVMLTNGWRRFKWEDVVKGKLPAITYPKDSMYLSLSGKLYGVTRAQLSGTESLFLFIKQKDSGTQSLFIPIEKDGSFNDPNYIFFDTLRVYYQLKSKFFSNAEARFMTDRLPAFNYKAVQKQLLNTNPFGGDTSGNYRHKLLAAEALKLQNAQRGKLMETVTVTAKKKSPVEELDEKYAKGLFSGGDGYQFDLINDPAAIGRLNIFNYLQGRVAGLQISSAGTGSPTLTWRGGAPQIYLDEMPVDADLLNNIPMSDIAFVKVFRPPFLGSGGNGANGAIAIYTRRGDDLKSRPGQLSTNSVMAYTPIREFYSPNYSTFDKRNEQKDVRTTLYWNPLLTTTSGNNTIKLNWYNNDVTKAFRVVIEGLSKEGFLTHYEEIME